MARKATIEKHKRQVLGAKKYREIRKNLCLIRDDKSLPVAERRAAARKLTKTRAYSVVRVTRRCNINGRSRGVYRRFGVCRHEIYRLLMQGMFPGARKASW